MGGGMPPSPGNQGMPYPGQYMGAMQGNPPNQLDLSAEEKAQKKKQIVLVAVVGFVCLAIFITGVVLFVTTKF